MSSPHVVRTPRIIKLQGPNDAEMYRAAEKSLNEPVILLGAKWLLTHYGFGGPSGFSGELMEVFEVAPPKWEPQRGDPTPRPHAGGPNTGACVGPARGAREALRAAAFEAMRGGGHQPAGAPSSDGLKPPSGGSSGRLPGVEAERKHGLKQPELMDGWGVTFTGKAETVTGDMWWYTDADGKRHPLIPRETGTAPLRAAIAEWASRGPPMHIVNSWQDEVKRLRAAILARGTSDESDPNRMSDVDWSLLTIGADATKPPEPLVADFLTEQTMWEGRFGCGSPKPGRLDAWAAENPPTTRERGAGDAEHHGAAGERE